MSAEPFVSPFTDDPDQIGDDVLLYRLIDPDWIDWQSAADSGNGPRLKQVAFQDYRKEDAERRGYPGPCMSVAVGNVLAELGIAPGTLPTILNLGATYGVASFTAGQARLLEAGRQGVRLEPEATGAWHGIVFCIEKEKKSGAMSKGLARLARWVSIPHQDLG